jgi:hypothetical protein
MPRPMEITIKGLLISLVLIALSTSFYKVFIQEDFSVHDDDLNPFVSAQK